VLKVKSHKQNSYILFNILERIVLLYLELQFPLSAISLRFAARIPPTIGANGLFIFLFGHCEGNAVKCVILSRNNNNNQQPSTLNQS
jgi:hypothetical protein